MKYFNSVTCGVDGFDLFGFFVHLIKSLNMRLF